MFLSHIKQLMVAVITSVWFGLISILHSLCLKKIQKELSHFVKNQQAKPEKPHVFKTKARKPICVSDKLDGECIEVDLADATSQVRKQIVTWQNAQKDVHLRQSDILNSYVQEGYWAVH